MTPQQQYNLAYRLERIYRKNVDAAWKEFGSESEGFHNAVTRELRAETDDVITLDIDNKIYAAAIQAIFAKHITDPLERPLWLRKYSH